MTKPQIRLGCPADAGLISQIVLRCLNEVNVKDYGPVLIAEQVKDWTLERVLARLRERLTFVAVDEGAIIGVAGFDGKQVRTVFIRPDRHGQGTGSRLMRAVEAVARESELEQLTLLSSITAQAFYRKLGYGAVRDVFNGEERTILMQKPLVRAEPARLRSGLAVYAMCGLAFSGKSTAARHVADALRLELISLDGINVERGLHGGDGLSDARWEETSFVAMARLRRHLMEGRSVLVDDTFSHRFLRDRCRRVAETCGATMTILFVDTPLEVIQFRRRENALTATREHIDDQVFEHHAARFQFPQHDESIVRITTNDDLERWIAGAAARLSPNA